jgi:hypothetical protein
VNSKNPSSAHIRRILLIIYAPIPPDCFEKGDQFFTFFLFFSGLSFNKKGIIKIIYNAIKKAHCAQVKLSDV